MRHILNLAAAAIACAAIAQNAGSQEQGVLACGQAHVFTTAGQNTGNVYGPTKSSAELGALLKLKGLVVNESGYSGDCNEAFCDPGDDCGFVVVGYPAGSTTTPPATQQGSVWCATASVAAGYLLTVACRQC